MSTILNALRRLEEDASAGETQPTDSLPATDPRATDELRSRILEEEQAALARAEPPNQGLLAQPLARAFAAAAVLLGAISLGIFVIAPGLTSSDSPTSPSTKPAALAAASPTHQLANPARANPPSVTNRPPIPNSPALRPASIPAGQPSAPSLAAAAVTPTPAMREATTGIQAATAPSSPRTSIVVASAPPSRPSTETSLASLPLSDSRRETIAGDHDRPSPPSRAPEARPTPSLTLARTASVSAPPTPTTITTPTPTSTPTRSTGTPIDARPVVDDSTTANSSDRSVSSPLQSTTQSQIESPAESAAGRAPEANHDRAAEPAVQQHIASPTPDIAVLQTAWHPTPNHRSAKVRLLENDETLTLREGDAVGPLVVQQITPSAVIFLSGDIELRLRVGQPGAGG